MQYTFGFIGTGNMASALLRSIIKQIPAQQIYLSNRTPEKAEALAKKLGCYAVDNIVAAQCDFVFLCVKPHLISEVLDQIAPVLANRKEMPVLVSIAAGVTMEKLQSMAGKPYPVIRMMPNTPVAVGEGIIMYDYTHNVSEASLEAFCYAVKSAGLVDHLPEELIDAGTCVSGCGPAFACLFMEALADGAVACGLPRAKSLLYASQMLKGIGTLANETRKHPAQLKDEVCSPGGSTIAGIAALEAGAFRGDVISAVKSSYEKNKQLG